MAPWKSVKRVTNHNVLEMLHDKAAHFPSQRLPFRSTFIEFNPYLNFSPGMMWWTYFLWRSSWDLQSSLTELLTKLLHQQQEVNSAQAEDSPKERNILSEKEMHLWYGVSLTHWDTNAWATREQILVLLKKVSWKKAKNVWKVITEQGWT